jgi:hypothetical protein
MKYCIATVQKPLSQEHFSKLVEMVKSSAAEGGNTLQGLVIVPGQGCWNWGVMLDGPDEERFMESLTLVLQPGKYSRAPDDDPAVSEGVFRFDPET